MSRASKYVQVPSIADDDGALEAQWAGISKKRAERAIRRRSTVTAMVGAAAACLLMGGAWWMGTRTGVPEASLPASVASPARDAVGELARRPEVAPPIEVRHSAPNPAPIPVPGTAEIALANGSVFRAAPGAAVSACGDDDIERCLQVDDGTVIFEPAAASPLSVRAGGMQVRADGSRFVVTVTRKVAGASPRVKLRVETGAVEVFRGDEAPVELAAGASVSFDGSWARDEARPDAPAKIADGREATTGAPPRNPAADDAGQAVADPVPQSLWSRAKEARRSGDHEAAARAYAELLDAHADDPKAGLAALELARLRMDTLDDVAGAIAPLRRALRERRASIREDALARLVRAHADLGHDEACRQRRREYLDTFPDGVHTSTVSRACGAD